MSSEKVKWTSRGTGKCTNCSWQYSTFKKPERCSNCNFFIGGKYIPNDSTGKKRKLDNPPAVTVCSFAGNSIFSIQVSTKDDRCFCLVSDTNRLCYYTLVKMDLEFRRNSGGIPGPGRIPGGIRWNSGVHQPEFRNPVEY